MIPSDTEIYKGNLEFYAELYWREWY